MGCRWPDFDGTFQHAGLRLQGILRQEIPGKDARHAIQIESCRSGSLRKAGAFSNTLAVDPSPQARNKNERKDRTPGYLFRLYST